jgi:transposase
MPHGEKISPEVQWIILRLSKLLKNEQIAMCVGVSERSIRRIISHFREHGTIEVAGSVQEERTNNKHLRDIDVEFLLGAVNQAPDLYLDELKEMLEVTCGVSVSRSTVWRTLRRAGFTMKKITRVAAERSGQKRLEYIARIGKYSADQLVFVDESSVDRRTTYRGHAWSIRGTKAQRKAFFVRGRRYSVLPALSLREGIIHCEIVEGSFCTETFLQFIEGLLDNMQAYPAPNSVIVMDNCRIHKHPEILELIDSRGMICEFLPPYSPDLNPIELAFSAMKYHLRRNGDYTRMAMTEMSDEEIYIALLKALYIISAQDSFGWYTHCGYV